MSIGQAMDDASYACLAARCGGAREALIVAMLLYGLAQSGEALAGDQSASVVKDIQPIVGGTPLSMAFAPTAATLAAAAGNDHEYSTTDFRQRKTGTLNSPSSREIEPAFESQPLHATSAWQRLADYRAQGRIQLVTLWESSRSTVSLQSGKHGGPSLQWSSRVMNRGGATRGLLDRFVASSLNAAGLGPRAAARSSASAPANKPINLIPAAKSP
jgi:hypothetical protein